MRAIGIIPARGGSVRLPRKNVMPFMGRPLIAWTVRAALDSGVLDRVLVSTDDPEIAEAAKQAGAEVPFLRPAHLATSAATSFDVVAHLIAALPAPPDSFALLQPTSPLRDANDVRRAFAMLTESDAPAVVSVCAFGKPWPVLRAIDARGVLDAVPEPVGGAPSHAINGAIYFERLTPFLAAGSFTPSGTLGYVMPPERSIDIDTATDFITAEALATRMGDTA